MTNQAIRSIIDDNIKILQTEDTDKRYSSPCSCPFPSQEKLQELVNCVRDICFPGYFEHVEEIESEHKLRDNFLRIHHILPDQIYFGMSFAKECNEGFQEQSKLLCVQFLNEIPKIKRLLISDVKAMYHNDPAAKNTDEVILCYPTIRAMLHHRIAHSLFVLNIPILPRMIAEMAHAETGIDIHPGAHIGEYFCIDHGTGVVIGQTSIIGSHVCLYQGVTLGAKSFSLDEDGKPIDRPRHPIIEDHVTIYSNASILGRITIGAHSIVGGNVWVTSSIPPHSRIIQQRALDISFSDGAGI